MDGDNARDIRVCSANVVAVTYSAIIYGGSCNTVAVEATHRLLDLPKANCKGVKNTEKLISTNANGATISNSCIFIGVEVIIAITLNDADQLTLKTLQYKFDDCMRHHIEEHQRRDAMTTPTAICTRVAIRNDPSHIVNCRADKS